MEQRPTLSLRATHGTIAVAIIVTIGPGVGAERDVVTFT